MKNFSEVKIHKGDFQLDALLLLLCVLAKMLFKGYTYKSADTKSQKLIIT